MKIKIELSSSYEKYNELKDYILKNEKIRGGSTDIKNVPIYKILSVGNAEGHLPMYSRINIDIQERALLGNLEDQKKIRESLKGLIDIILK